VTDHGIRYRTLFISDVNLGTKGCQSALLLDFLRTVDADTIYLVGDIVDGWRLKANWWGSCRAFAINRSWTRSAEEFALNIVPLRGASRTTKGRYTPAV
jgi:UDP-2,3-diacylglucosamine pyrophosphatase LpxH